MLSDHVERDGRRIECFLIRTSLLDLSYMALHGLANTDRLGEPFLLPARCITMY